VEPEVPDLLIAFFRMETVEHSAKMTLAAEMAGEPVLLLRGDVAKNDGGAGAIFREATSERCRRTPSDKRQRRGSG